MSDCHVALIVEDDPHIAEIMKELVKSLGHAWRHVVTLADVRAAIAEGGYCYVLLDMQIPADAESSESVGCGETALQLLRRAAPARTAAGKHVVPIIVVTGYSREHDFVSKMYDMDANGFIPKPFGERLDLVLDKIRAALARAEREDHAACAVVPGARVTPSPLPIAANGGAPAGAVVVRLRIDGTGEGGRNSVHFDGARVLLQDSLFIPLFKAAAVHDRAPGVWSAADKLGIATREWAPSRLHAALKGVVPEGFKVVETNRGTGYRLNPAVVVEGIGWRELGEHGDAGVRKVAEEWGRRKGCRSS